ncbi:methyltransferase [Streptomyces adelaidensis]|uniref:methyltransferase n=1 Tax=Streptomyces adelaidensis TaxID=2796465 RepID=UPI0019078B90|nr:methyltransferase [Streptomyces adelaidensis]
MPPTVPPVMPLTQMLAGFQISQALYVIAKLDVATRLADGPRDLASLASETGAHEEALGRLIRTLAPFGLFQDAGAGRVAVTPLGAFLSATHPMSLRPAALFWMETHYLPFGGLLDTVRTGMPAAETYYGKPFFDWVVEEPERVALTNSAMAGVVASVRAGMFDDYVLPGGGTVADLGGADGTVIAELLSRNPDQAGIVFDLPEVVSAAHGVLAARGLTDRVEVLGGSFFEEVPAADVYVLAYVLHDWNDEESGRILAAIRKAARPGARLLVIEAIVPEGDEPHLAKVVDLTMLGMLSGRERTEAEYERLLGGAGFTLDRVVATPSPLSILETTLL